MARHALHDTVEFQNAVERVAGTTDQGKSMKASSYWGVLQNCMEMLPYMSITFVCHLKWVNEAIPKTSGYSLCDKVVFRSYA